MNFNYHKYTAIALIAVFCSQLYSAPPAWWAERGVISTEPSSNYSPVNIGQLKWVAKQAMNEIENKVDVGAGYQIRNLVNGFMTHTASNYAPVNIGQLKNVGKYYYDWLIALGYDTRLNLRNHGESNWIYLYPWTTDVPSNGSNYGVAVLGQLKWVFCFDLTGFTPTYVDSDTDGIYDIFEYSLYGDLNGNTDTDGDGLANYDETLLGFNPNNPSDIIVVPAGGGSINLEVCTPL